MSATPEPYAYAAQAYRYGKGGKRGGVLVIAGGPVEWRPSPTFDAKAAALESVDTFRRGYGSRHVVKVQALALTREGATVISEWTRP